MTTAPLTLPGQAAAPDGPADMTMMYVLHHAFRRDLADFARAVRATATDDQPRWGLLRERWLRFTHELHQHHTKEDEILWPLLLERVRTAGDVDSERVLYEMEEEHAVLDPLLTTATDAFEMLAVGPDAAAHDVLDEALGELSGVLHHHLGHEESAAIAILQRYVGGREWARLERKRFRPKQSLAQARFFVPWALKDVPEDGRRRVLALGGPPLRLIHATSRRRFAADEERVFGVTPSA